SVVISTIRRHAIFTLFPYTTLFRSDHQGMTMGAIMRNPEAERRPAWGFYFGVDDVDAATTRATVAGGKLLHGPTEVPGGSFIIRSEEHTSELQSRENLVCRLLLEKK